MAASDSYAIGIDLGTTYCCLAVLRHHSHQKAEVIESEVGSNTTPSYVAYEFEDGKESFCVGEAAKDLAMEDPENTIFDTKRLIGRSFYDTSIQKYKELWPFHLVNMGGLVGVQLGGKNLLSHSIAKELISHLKITAEKNLGGSIDSAVVTIPVYYSEIQQGLTRWACEAAGFTSVHLLAEPVAAAVAYGLQSSIDSHATKTCLIFDLGGGTFDVTVFQLDQNKQVLIKGSGGDNRLGGEDFNDLLTQYCIDKFKEINKVDIAEGKSSTNAEVRRKTAKTLRRIRNECEKKKRFLSSTKAVTVSLDCVYGDKSMNFKITREIFENLIDSLLKRSITILDETLRTSGVEKNAIDDVILIGGSSRILKVQQMVAEYFEGKSILRSVDTDEAVACGAAIHAYNIFKNKGAPLSVVTLKEQTPVAATSSNTVQPVAVSAPKLQTEVKIHVLKIVNIVQPGPVYDPRLLQNPIRWSRTVEGFPIKLGHAAVAVGTNIFSIGGRTWSGSSESDSPMDIFVLNVDETEMKWKPIKPNLSSPSTFTPGQRFCHTTVSYKHNVIIFGGWDYKTNDLNSVCRFNTETLKWDEPNVTGTLPEARWFHSAVAIQNEMIIFGGRDLLLNPLNDVHSLNMDTFVWSNITTIKGTPPTIRWGHSAVVYKNRFIYIFGGYNWNENYLNDVICLDWSTKEWTRPETSGTIPQPRDGHSAFTHKGLMYIYGGEIQGGSDVNDLFSYNPVTEEWREVKPIEEPPSPREHFSCVAVNNSVYIFGGTENYRDGLDDTFVLDLE